MTNEAFNFANTSAVFILNPCCREYFENTEVHNAAYAHEWDPGGSRMLVVGGPLASGLTGSYVAMWQ